MSRDTIDLLDDLVKDIREVRKDLRLLEAKADKIISNIESPATSMFPLRDAQHLRDILCIWAEDGQEWKKLQSEIRLRIQGELWLSSIIEDGFLVEQFNVNGSKGKERLADFPVIQYCIRYLGKLATMSLYHQYKLTRDKMRNRRHRRNRGSLQNNQ